MKLLPAFTGVPEVNKVYNVDALTLLKAMPDNSVDLVVTSPPYDNLRTYNGYTFDFEPIARETYRVMKPGGVVVWVVGDATINGSETLTSMRQALYFVDVCGFRMHQRLIWQKDKIPQIRPKAYIPDFEDMFIFSKGEPNAFNPITRLNKNAGQKLKKGHSSNEGFRYNSGIRFVNEQSILTNVWLVRVGNANQDDRTGHPAPFPELLAERHILTWSNAGDIVLDYFGGSGTTAKMSRKLGRKYLYCDVSQEYCNLATRRLEMPYTPDMFIKLEAESVSA